MSSFGRKIFIDPETVTEIPCVFKESIDLSTGSRIMSMGGFDGPCQSAAIMIFFFFMRSLGAILVTDKYTGQQLLLAD